MCAYYFVTLCDGAPIGYRVCFCVLSVQRSAWRISKRCSNDVQKSHEGISGTLVFITYVFPLLSPLTQRVCPPYYHECTHTRLHFFFFFSFFFVKQPLAQACNDSSWTVTSMSWMHIPKSVLLAAGITQQRCNKAPTEPTVLWPRDEQVHSRTQWALILVPVSLSHVDASHSGEQKPV